MSRGLVTFIGDNRRARRPKTIAGIPRPSASPARTVAQQAKIRSSAGTQVTEMVRKIVFQAGLRSDNSKSEQWYIRENCTGRF
jgi:hypothetical protein